MNALGFEFAARNGCRVLALDGFRRFGITGVESVKRRVAPRGKSPKWDQKRVELAFGTVELRSICESRRRATTVIGAEAARELAQWLADVSAVATVAELADLFGTDIIERSPSERALRLQAGHDLVFCAGHVQVPIKADGATDWAKVSRIRIIALEPRNG